MNYETFSYLIVVTMTERAIKKTDGKCACCLWQNSLTTVVGDAVSSLTHT